MPTIVQLGNVCIRMFAADHQPPHFHIWTPEGEALVLLKDLSVLRGVLRRRDLDVALAWARENRKQLEREWERLNG